MKTAAVAYAFIILAFANVAAEVAIQIKAPSAHYWFEYGPSMGYPR